MPASVSTDTRPWRSSSRVAPRSACPLAPGADPPGPAACSRVVSEGDIRRIIVDPRAARSTARTVVLLPASRCEKAGKLSDRPGRELRVLAYSDSRIFSGAEVVLRDGGAGRAGAPGGETGGR